MKSRLAKKLCTTPFNRLSPGWSKALITGKRSERINEALRMWKRYEKKQKSNTMRYVMKVLNEYQPF